MNQVDSFFYKMSSSHQTRLIFGVALAVMVIFYNIHSIGNYSVFVSTVETNSNSSDEYLSVNEDNVAHDLKQKVRVLCWVMTGPETHKTKAQAIKNTWGPRCNTVLYMSSEMDSTLPTIALPIGEGRNNLWGKTREAFHYIWDNYRDRADWFFKADDDTYVVVENLRFMLSGYNTSDAIWFGYKYKVIVEGGYNSGGPGYVLSREALKRFAEQGLTNSSICKSDPTGAEDAEMGKCLHNLAVKSGDSRDAHGRDLFSPFNVESQLFPGEPNSGYWCDSLVI